ncbi:uncharacterized protein TNCV_2282901 [Trichonephila clavipes]|uniref:Uncharacterized protein n=1 Tax=Trichonephila clavipes TaxID=2585209 RepID=A0A8X6R9N0_TRICX|nr:uncharacterized protein TNCV_2282901 [Trichonephila clavipes]
MYASSSFVIPTPLAHAGNQGEGHPHICAQRDLIYMTPRTFKKFLEGIDNQVSLLEIPSDLSCAYLTGHLLKESPKLVSDIRDSVSAEYCHGAVKSSVIKSIPCHTEDLEIRFYASQQRRDEEPTDFVYDLLKLNKKTRAGDVRERKPW